MTHTKLAIAIPTLSNAHLGYAINCTRIDKFGGFAGR
jgi:hypothetical protein